MRQMLLLYNRKVDLLRITVFKAGPYHTLGEGRIFLVLYEEDACSCVPRNRCLFITVQERSLFVISCEAYVVFRKSDTYCTSLVLRTILLKEDSISFTHAYLLRGADHFYDFVLQIVLKGADFLPRDVFITWTTAVTNVFEGADSLPRSLHVTWM